MQQQQRQQQRIAVIGTGFAGLWSALAARRLIESQITKHRQARHIEVVVVAPKPEFVIRPALYQQNPASKVVDVSELYRVTGVSFIHGHVEGVNVSEKEIDYVDPEGAPWSLPYDRLILAAGSCLSRPNIPGLAEHAFNVDQLEDAVQLDDHIKSLKLLPVSRARNTVVVCGAGSTGLEVATELPRRLRAELGPNARPRVILVSREQQIGSSLGESSQTSIDRSLARVGVETVSGSAVVSVDAGGITTSTGQRIEALTVVWAAGMAPSPLAKTVDSEKDELGRLFVDENLRVPNTKDIFAAGDAACAVVDDEGNKTVMSSQYAQNMGRASGYNAVADLLGLPLITYTQPVYMFCVDLGPEEAVVTIGWDRRVVINGILGKKIKDYINDVMALPPAPNKEKALAAARMPSLLALRMSGMFLSTVATVRSIF